MPRLIYKSNSLPASQVASPAATYTPAKPTSLDFVNLCCLCFKPLALFK
nr:MAG TPA: hypothetical protein [Caudoviricetes sp.]